MMTNDDEIADSSFKKSETAKDKKSARTNKWREEKIQGAELIQRYKTSKTFEKENTTMAHKIAKSTLHTDTLTTSMGIL
jgi:deoxyhypusine synthase